MKVDVLFLSNGQLIIAGALLVFFLIAGGTIYYLLWKKRRDKYLRKYGIPTETNFLKV